MHELPFSPLDPRGGRRQRKKTFLHPVSKETLFSHPGRFLLANRVLMDPSEPLSLRTQSGSDDPCRPSSVPGELRCRTHISDAIRGHRKSPQLIRVRVKGEASPPVPSPPSSMTTSSGAGPQSRHVRNRRTRGAAGSAGTLGRALERPGQREAGPTAGGGARKALRPGPRGGVRSGRGGTVRRVPNRCRVPSDPPDPPARGGLRATRSQYGGRNPSSVSDPTLTESNAPSPSRDRVA